MFGTCISQMGHDTGRLSLGLIRRYLPQRLIQWSGVCPYHRGRVAHICVIRLTITGSVNGQSPDRRQAIIQTNAGKLLI